MYYYIDTVDTMYYQLEPCTHFFFVCVKFRQVWSFWLLQVCRLAAGLQEVCRLDPGDPSKPLEEVGFPSKLCLH